MSRGNGRSAGVERWGRALGSGALPRGCRGERRSYTSARMSNELPVRPPAGGGLPVIGGLALSSPAASRALWVSGGALCVAIELGSFCSPTALLVQGAALVVLVAAGAAVAQGAQTSRHVRRWAPWLLWPLAFVAIALSSALIGSIWFGWPWTLPILDICRD
jgi:hypothetical protein